jgi:hypothetical protein
VAFANGLLSVILKDDDLEKTILEIQNKTGKNILNPSIAFRPSTIRGALMLNNIVKKGSNSICGLDASNEQMGWVMIKGRGGVDLHSFASARRVVRVCLFMGFIFADLALCLTPVLICSTVLAASLFVQFIGTLGDLRGHINRFLGHSVRNAPSDHRDLHGVVDDQARDHRIGENRERLQPGQWHESRETHECQGSACERIRRES